MWTVAGLQPWKLWNSDSQQDNRSRATGIAGGFDKCGWQAKLCGWLQRRWSRKQWTAGAATAAARSMAAVAAVVADVAKGQGSLNNRAPELHFQLISRAEDPQPRSTQGLLHL